MKRIVSIALLLCITVTLFTACNKADDNSKYIPKDATAVFSVDMASIGKKMAWEFLFGSDMFKKMTEGAGKDSSKMTDLQNAGIDLLNTFYTYVVADQRYSNGQRFVALIPLSDGADWEAYVKKTFPEAKIKTADKRKEALLADGMYAAWNEDLLVLTNTANGKEDMAMEDGTYVPPAPDLLQTAAEIDNIFKMNKDNAITSRKQYNELVKAGHDLSLWINYENIMNNYGAGMMGGFTMSSAMMKEAAFTMGFNFEKGAIKGAMKYYVSDEMKAATRDLMNGKIDKEIVERLPANNLNLLTTMNFSPMGLKSMLDKMGLLGMINVGLTEQNLTADDVFESFTGDMALTMNNFKLVQQKHGYSHFNEDMVEVTDSMTTYDPAMDWLYVMKINKQDKFDKLLKLALGTGMMVDGGNGNYKVASGNEGMQITVKNKYLVVSSSEKVSTDFISGANKGQKLHEVAARQVNDHPMCMFFDVKEMLKNVTPETMDSDKERAQFAEVKKLMDNIIISGGEFKGDAFQYDMAINFINKEENSLMQLMQMANKMSEIEKQKEQPATAAK